MNAVGCRPDQSRTLMKAPVCPFMKLQSCASGHFSGFIEAGYNCSHRMGSPVSPKRTTPATGR